MLVFSVDAVPYNMAIFPDNCFVSDFLLQKQSLDLAMSDHPAGNPDYVQTTPAGYIPFGF